MKKLTAYLLLPAITLAILTGCKGKDASVTNDPKTVLSAFFERISKKDMDGAAKLATKESQATLNMMKKAIETAEKMGMKDTASKDDPSEDFKKMELGEVKIDGDHATVAVTNKGKDNEKTDFPLKKEDGQWKVDFSMGTLMKMGMDKGGKTAPDYNMPDTSGLNKQMMDSLEKIMNNMNDTTHQ